MGIDMDIYYESTDGNVPTDLRLEPVFGEIEPAHEGARKVGATHRVRTLVRWYGIGYERGYWPSISGVLMGLFASTNVKRIWYVGESDIEKEEPITVDMVLAISRHYMLNGERPYRLRTTMETQGNNR